MKRKLTIFITLLIILFGCTQNPDVEETQLSPSINKLQITFIQHKENQDFTEFYVIDITCMSAEKICLGEPKLLFQSLKSSNNDQKLPKGLIFDYGWSPDGNKIVLESATDILIGDINTWTWSNITDTLEAEHSPKWSSDGKFIYYIACIEDPSGMCTPQLIKYDLASKQKLQLLQAWNKPFSSDYAVSPDGQRIIINTPVGINNVLYQVNWDGKDSHQITTLDVEEFAPFFSPDGQKIAFFRSTIQRSLDAKDEWNIIVKDLISGEEKNLTENFDNLTSSPIFSPDGKWLAFDAGDLKSNWDIFLVSLEQGNIIQITHGNEEVHPAWRSFSE